MTMTMSPNLNNLNLAVLAPTLFFAVGLSLPFARNIFAPHATDSGESRRRLTNDPSRLNVPSGVDWNEEYHINDRGMALYSQSFRPNNQEPKGLMLLCHGYAETSLWYFRDIAMDWVKEGYACVALDYEGHGKSDGLHAYIPDFDKMVDDVAVFHEKVAARPENAGLPRFLHGESMGGAVAIELSLRRPQLYQGMVLQAPMCKISEKVKPPAPIIGALRGLARIFPERAWTPSPDVQKNAYSDPAELRAARRYTFAYTRKVRLGTAIQMMSFSEGLESRLGRVRLPFLLLHGGADRVTDPGVSRALHEAAASEDKTFKLYDGLWHKLLCEPPEMKKQVWEDITAWVNKRASKEGIKSS